jgi:hypothetical protein
MTEVNEPRVAELERLKQPRLKGNPPGPLSVANEAFKTRDSQDSDYRRCLKGFDACLKAYPVALQHRSCQSYVITAGFAPDFFMMDAEYYFTLLGGSATERSRRVRERLRQRYPQSEGGPTDRVGPLG